MLNLNLGDVTGAISNNSKPLAAWNIHKVCFKGVKLGEYKDKNTNDDRFIMNFEFQGFDEENQPNGGVFRHSVFVPSTKADMERKKFPGSDKEYPSNVESFKYNMAHIVENVNKVAYEKLQKMAIGVDKISIEKLIDFINKNLGNEIKNNKPYFLKLGSDGKGRAQVYNFLNLSKDGNLFVNNFLSEDEEKVFFSAYELSRRDKIKSDNKPTNMDSISSGTGGISGNIPGISQSESDINDLADSLSGMTSGNDVDDLPF